MEDYFVATPEERDARSGVFQSDHDPVVAVARHAASGATMLVATFNCAGQSKPDVGGTWAPFLELIARGTSRALDDFSAVCVCLQEAGSHNTLAADLRDRLPTHAVFHQATAPLAARQFVVHCVVALSRSAYPSPATSGRSMHFGGLLKRTIVGSKGAAYVHVAAYPGFVVASAHLPMNKHDVATLGFTERIAAMDLIADRVVAGHPDAFVVVAGDLNFRRRRALGGEDELEHYNVLPGLGLAELRALGRNTCKLAVVPTRRGGGGTTVVWIAALVLTTVAASVASSM